MSNIHLKNITNELVDNKDSIENFLSGLDDEKNYLYLTVDRVMKSRLVIAALDKGNIVGLTGLNKKSFFFFTFIIINRNYQGQGLGKQLTLRLLEESKSFYELMFSAMLEMNMPSLKQHLSVGAKMIGLRKQTYYLFWPPSGLIGVLILWIIRAIFPVIKIYDSLSYAKRTSQS